MKDFLESEFAIVLLVMTCIALIIGLIAVPCLIGIHLDNLHNEAMAKIGYVYQVSGWTRK